MIRLLSIFLILALTTISYAQLKDETIAPDFNLTDIHGQQHHLYTYLNQGKTVILDFSATWCPLCWSYHQTNALKDFFILYGPNGSNEARVLFIEKDAQTTLADLMGNTGASAGDWVSGTPYPIIDDASLNPQYIPNALPTIYGIHPDKKLYHIGKLNTDQLYNFVQSFEGIDTVSQDTLIEYQLSEVVNITCNGFNDGAIAISVTGPGNEFFYSWNNGMDTEDIFGLGQGSYQCTITDNLGNETVTENIIVSEPATLSITFFKTTPSSNEAMDGSIMAEVSGGTPPYFISWNTGSNSPLLENIGEGIYSVVVRDINGCEIMDAAELDVPDCSLVLSVNVRPSSCANNAEGSINTLVDGGVPPFSYRWSTGDTTGSLTNILPGLYEVTVSDAIGCTTIYSDMVQVRDDEPPVANVRSGVIVYLNAQGNGFLNPSAIDNNSTDNCGIHSLQVSTQNFTCIAIGPQLVTFTVIDENLNLASKQVEIMVIDTFIPFYQCPQDITVNSCEGIVTYDQPVLIDNCLNGSLRLFNGIGSGNIFPVGLSTESFVYVDRFGNRATCSFDVNVEARISASVIVNDAKCSGESTGSATVQIEDTNRNYKYNWSNGQTTQSAVNLSAGTYSVTVSDESECTFKRTIFLGEPAELFVRLDSVKLVNNRGELYVSVFGGTPPYSYQWSNSQGVISTVQDPKNLAFGDYFLRVTDFYGCVLNNFVATVDATTSAGEETFRGLTIAPNPAAGQVSVIFPEQWTGMAELTLISMTGRRELQRRVSVTQQVILPVDSFPPGLYFLDISFENNRVRRKVLLY